MDLKDVVVQRLLNQQILDPAFKTPKEVVGYMGAMQAQDYAMAKWAIGLRMKQATETTIDKAIDKGEILRTHVLRPTWHFVLANDIYWMLELTAPRIRAALRSRDKELGISEAVLKKSKRLFEKALGKGEHLLRETLLAELETAKIDTGNNRSAHFLLHAELDGLISSGAAIEGKRSYALLESRVPKKLLLSREEALAKLAGIYFKSHGPATLPDFSWWSGLSATDARKAVTMIKSNLQEEPISGVSYWFYPPASVPKKQPQQVMLLPAFDEFLISYKDRSASILVEHQKKAFSSNGIFWPTVIVDGKVTGIWKRSIKNETVILETEYFKPHTQDQVRALKRSAERLGSFLQKKVQLPEA